MLRKHCNLKDLSVSKIRFQGIQDDKTFLRLSVLLNKYFLLECLRMQLHFVEIGINT